MAAQYRYGPWGELEHEAASVQNPIRYTGREWDPETGLYFYRARYYDPQVGRFVSEDPIGLAGGINLFAYALNDPVNLRDPSGLNPRCVTGMLPEHDPRYSGDQTWTFRHKGEDWVGVSIGNTFLLCPAPIGGQQNPMMGGRATLVRQAQPRLRTRPLRCGSTMSPSAPADVDLSTNIAVAEWARENVWLPARLVFFRNLVNYGGPWDYKTISMEFEPYGKWHYGVAGWAMGFHPQLLLRAAGWAQQRQPYADPSLGNWWDLWGTYGDEAADQHQIRRGMDAYDSCIS